jgi:hypothetical protein
VDVVADLIAPLLPILPNLKFSDLYMRPLSNLLPPTAEFLVRASAKGCLDLSSIKNLGLPAAIALSSFEGKAIFGLNKIDLGVAEALSKIQGELTLSDLSSITEAAASALGRHVGGLCLGLKDLPEPIAAALAVTQGDLEFPKLSTLSSAAAAALSVHVGKLTLGSTSFKLNAAAASHLARHDGPLIFGDVREIDADAALALSGLKHHIEISNTFTIPEGTPGVIFCEKMAMKPEGNLHFYRKQISPACAAALAKFNGTLLVEVDKKWNDAALIALASHHGQLEINPKHLSDEVGRALGQRDADSALVLNFVYGMASSVSLTSAAAEALGNYPGKLTMEVESEMTTEVAAHLVKRSSMRLLHSKLKSAVRKVFDSAGTWTDNFTWTRKS